MKANEAPEKIYCTPAEGGFYLTTTKPEPPVIDGIEYIRADSFIKNALKWYCLDCECNDNCKDTKCFFYTEYKRYLKGETNALPPKFEYTILNPDGSTSDNWRYRHFIKRMQDAFIEKARKWFEKRNEWIDLEGNRQCDIESFEDFENYMKGE